MCDTTKITKEDVSAEEFDEMIERLRHSEALLTELSKGYWISTLDDADNTPGDQMGQRVVRYWKRFINS